MPTPLTELVEGWTGALPFTLNADGVPVDLTGLTVQIVLKDGADTLVKDTTAGISTSSGSTGGVVVFTPSSSGTDFVAARTPYKIRFRVTDAAGKVVFFPNADEDLILVNVL